MDDVWGRITYWLFGASEPRWMRDLSNNLERVLADATGLKSKREELYESYRNWLLVNENAISSAVEVRDKIVDTNRENNYISPGTSTTGIAGITVSICGACAAVSTGGASLILTGEILAEGSAVASVGSDEEKDVINKSLREDALKILQINKTCTISFSVDCRRYFRAVNKFTSFFNIIRGNGVALSVFYEAADQEGFRFLDDLMLERLSRNQMLEVLKEVIKCVVPHMNPKMWSVDILRGASNRVKSVGEKIRKMIHEIIRIIEADSCLSEVLRNKFRKFLISILGSNHQPNTRTIKMLTAGTKWCKCRHDIYGNNNAFAVGKPLSLITGIRRLNKELLNLRNGSQSEECKNITTAINNLREIRRKVMEEMERCFGWKFD